MKTIFDCLGRAFSDVHTPVAAPSPARLARWRPLPTLWALAAAVPLGIASILLPRSPQGHAAAAPATPSMRQEWELARHLERYALNALLVPLFDEADHPQRWVDPTPRLFCGSASRVGIDGRALVPDAEMAGRSFSVQWRMDNCLPFGIDGPALTGRAELDVFREELGYSAIVRLSDLRVQRDGVTVVLTKTFSAATP